MSCRKRSFSEVQWKPRNTRAARKGKRFVKQHVHAVRGRLPAQISYRSCLSWFEELGPLRLRNHAENTAARRKLVFLFDGLRLRRCIHKLSPIRARGQCPGAQISNLLSRRIASCGAPAGWGALRVADALPIANRRYRRVQLCATRTESLINLWMSSRVCSRSQLAKTESRAARSQSFRSAKLTHRSQPHSLIVGLWTQYPTNTLLTDF